MINVPRKLHWVEREDLPREGEAPAEPQRGAGAITAIVGSCLRAITSCVIGHRCKIQFYTNAIALHTAYRFP